MCSRCHFVDHNNITQKSEKIPKSRLLFLLDKSSSGGLISGEIDEAEELIKSATETNTECRMEKIYQPHAKAIGDIGLCRKCCEFRLHNVLPSAKLVVGIS